MSEVNTVTAEDSKGSVKIIYYMYIASILVGFLGLIGLIMAYVKRGDAPDWLKSHYTFQVRTFWIGLLYMVIAILLIKIYIGWLFLLAAFAWWVMRCVRGLKAVEKQQAPENPGGWLL
ncbi:MAG: hypothetical protein V3U76_08515 [Granulosicoccus sp.]